MDVVPQSPQAIEQALRVLTGGGIVVHATETCYGITCDLSNKEAVARLFAVKRRNPTQAVSALFANADRAAEYVEWSPTAMNLAARHLPGPLTIVLPRKAGALPLFPAPEGEHPTLGVRISPHPTALEIATRFPRPVSTTSANIHGLPAAYDAASVLRQFGDLRPDLLIDAGTLKKAPPSTVIRVDGETVTVLRQGDLRIP
jgi:L-threonylcarbamoyladenylate synthase